MNWKDVPEGLWKSLATAAIWTALGVCAACGVPEMKEVASMAAITTTMMWLLG